MRLKVMAILALTVLLAGCGSNAEPAAISSEAEDQAVVSETENEAEQQAMTQPEESQELSQEASGEPDQEEAENAEDEQAEADTSETDENERRVENAKNKVERVRSAWSAMEDDGTSNWEFLVATQDNLEHGTSVYDMENGELEMYYSDGSRIDRIEHAIAALVHYYDHMINDEMAEYEDPADYVKKFANGNALMAEYSLYGVPYEEDTYTHSIAFFAALLVLEDGTYGEAYDVTLPDGAKGYCVPAKFGAFDLDLYFDKDDHFMHIYADIFERGDTYWTLSSQPRE